MKKEVLAVLLITCSGCSNKGVYNGIQTDNRNKCSKLPSSEQEECARANNKSFEEYERERQELLNY